MINTEIKSQHSKEVTKFGGTVYDKAGYRMDVNLWFRHKNEALFYIDSVGKVHGPMDQTYSTRLGPIQKSGREITYKKEFNEQVEKDQWRKTLEFQKTQPMEIRQETKHFETVLRDVSSNEMNNHKKSVLTLANHFIPSYKNVETNNYSTTITKQNKKPDQGVTVKIVAPSEKVIEKEITTTTTTRERRLIDELLEARQELNTLRRTKSVVDNSSLENDMRNYTSEHHVSKVVTDVYPSTNFSEKIKRRHHSTHQENSNKSFPENLETGTYQTKQNFMESSQKIESTPIDNTFYNEIRTRHGLDKPVGQQIPITVQTGNRSRNLTENVSYNNSSTITSNQNLRSISPVQRIESVHRSQDSNGHDLMGEEKTVTIKRKITKRKKASENVNTLRDSYIEKINTAPQKFSYGDTSSDTDVELQPIKETPVNQEMVVPVKSTPRLEQPTNLKEVMEDVIVPVIKKKDKQEIPFEKSDKLVSPTNQSIIRNDLQKNPDWNYVDHSVSRGQTPQLQRNNNDSTTYNTYIQEKSTVPVSSYSARKENMRTQQMMDGRNGSMRNIPMDRRVNEMTEEIETITLQPIGKGVQDLATGVTTISRAGSRAATPRAYETSGGVSRNNFFREEQRHTGTYNTMPAMPKFNKYNSDKNYSPKSITTVIGSNNSYRPRLSPGGSANARNVSQISSYDIPDSYKRVGSVGRSGGQEQVNSSWHTRTESYTGGNRAFPSLLSPVSNHESIMTSNMITSGVDEGRFPLQMILNSEELWYQPNLNREDVINVLRDKETGSFIIRNSSTFAGAYGLALKVASLPDNAVKTNDSQGDLIRHFLIETVDDASGSGVRLKGFTNEPVYRSLAHLVQDHCQNARALPTKLFISSYFSGRMDHEDSGLVPSQSQSQSQSQYQYETHQRQQMGTSRAQLLSSAHRSMSSPGVNFIDINHPNPLHRHLVTTALYLGKFDVDRLTGKPAIEQAVTRLMSKKNTKTTTAEVRLDSTNGITLTDKMQTVFYTRQIPAQHVLSAEFDPQLREYTSPILQNNGINRGRIIGIVIRKQKMILRENTVHLFCEIDRGNDLTDIITFVNENYLRRAC